MFLSIFTDIFSMSKRQKDKDDNVKDKKWRKQEFLADYSEKWPALVASEKGPTWCKCTVCDDHFQVSHGGRDDCKRHVAGLGRGSADMQTLSFHDCASLLKIQFLVIKI
jgi:hypothetical protein